LKKKLTIGLVFLFVLALSLSVAAADWSDLQFSTDLGVNATQLEFDQYLYNSQVGTFRNNLDAQGEDLHLKNGASTGWMGTYYEDFDNDGLPTVKVQGHNYISFSQDFRMDDDGTCNTDFYSYQVFRDFGGNYISQRINSPDACCNGTDEYVDLWNNDLNSGQGIQGVFNDRPLPPGAGGRALLTQDGYFETSYLFSKQAGNVPGASGYNTVDLWNDGALMNVNLAQTEVWNGNWS